MEMESANLPTWPPGFFESTYGCLSDDPIERPPQGEFEERDAFELEKAEDFGIRD